MTATHDPGSTHTPDGDLPVDRLDESQYDGGSDGDRVEDRAADRAADEPAVTDVRSRRRLLGTGAVAAAATVVGTTVGGRRAAAANGDNLILGQENSATNPTILNDGEFSAIIANQRVGSLGRNVAGVGDDVPTGAYGFTGGTSRARAVWGQDETTDGVGVYGTHGEAQPGTGVTAQSFNGVGLVASGTTADIRAIGSGLINLNVANRTLGPTTAAAAGTLGRDANGVLWYAYADNTWQRLGGPLTSSAYVPIDPSRVYDSRAAQPNPGILARGSSRVVSVASGRNLTTGAVEFTAVPPGARAITYNVSIVNTVGKGFLTVNPGDKTTITAATINWYADAQIVNNGGTVRLDGNREIRVIADGDPGASTNFIIDVTGYHL